MSLKTLTLDDVGRIANTLIREHGETTTLDVKIALRLEGFCAEQKPVSLLMRQLASRENWSSHREQNHLVYRSANNSTRSELTIKPGAQTIVLVTVNEHETDAILDAFVGEKIAPKQHSIDGITYNVLGQYGDYEVVHTICEMGAGGVGASQQRTRDAIDHWKPKAIVAVGLAFGMNEDEQEIGDVLVATQVVNYELSRVNADGTVTLRGDKPTCSGTLVNRFKQTDTWGKRSIDAWPKLRFGPMLSGQKLVDNLDYRTSLNKHSPEAIGGEMEATGVYVSAVSSKVDWIIIKAICDWGHDKNNPGKERAQKTAAKNAAWVVLAALDKTRLLKDSPFCACGTTVRIPPVIQANVVRMRWPSHFPTQFVKEVDGLKIDSSLRAAVIDVITQSKFPSLMSLNGALVENPVWGKTEAQKIRRAYWPKGTRIPVIVRSDMLLVRRDNKKHEGELLTYPSKWGTHLIHFRPWKPEQNLADRDQLNRTKFAAKWGVPPETIKVSNTGKFSVSAKINEEYKDLWIYVFEFFSVHCSQWSEKLHQIHANGFMTGTPEEEKNRWRHLREMRNDQVACKVNGDVLRAVHHCFDVNLTSLPTSFPESGPE